MVNADVWIYWTYFVSGFLYIFLISYNRNSQASSANLLCSLQHNFRLSFRNKNAGIFLTEDALHSVYVDSEAAAGSVSAFTPTGSSSSSISACSCWPALIPNFQKRISPKTPTDQCFFIVLVVFMTLRQYCCVRLSLRTGAHILLIKLTLTSELRLRRENKTCQFGPHTSSSLTFASLSTSDF